MTLINVNRNQLRNLAVTWLGALIVGSFSASAQSFTLGDAFDAVTLRGVVTVFCPGGGTRLFSCSEDMLNPNEMAYFTLPEGVVADEVAITGNNGKKVITQTRNYNNEKKRSDKRYNLWIWTLFQKPLLNYGENSLKYVAKKDGKVVSSGEFKVQVKDTGTRECRHGVYSGSFPSDCDNGISICDRYFRDYNYCQ